MGTARRFSAFQMACATFDDLLVNVNGPDPITEDTWNRYIAFCAELPSVANVLTFSPRRSPNGAQRKRLIDAMGDRPIQAKVAIVTDSAMVRGAITAFSWLARLETKAFRPSELGNALDWLASSCHFDRAEVVDFLAEAIVEVGFTRGEQQTWVSQAS